MRIVKGKEVSLRTNVFFFFFPSTSPYYFLSIDSWPIRLPLSRGELPVCSFVRFDNIAQGCLRPKRHVIVSSSQPLVRGVIFFKREN